MRKPYVIGAKPQYFRVLIYGDPGVGKTELAASATLHPAMRDVLFINVDKGTDTVGGSGALAVDVGVGDDGLPSGDIVGDVEQTIWAVLQKKPGFETVKTIVLDNVTELQGQDLLDIVQESKKKKPNRSVDEIGRDDYGKSSTRLLRALRLLRDAPLHIIINAWVKRIQPEGASAPTEVTPSLTQQVGQVAQGLVSNVWLMYLDDKGVRKLLTAPSGAYRAKTRIPKFAEAIGPVITLPADRSVNLATIYDQLLKATTQTEEKKK